MGNILINTFFKQREEFNQSCAERDKQMPFPKGIKEIKDVPYVNDGTDAHRMDIFYPEGNDKTLPVIVDVHGGGMILGKKEFNRFFCAQLSSMGFLVFSIEFRLVPEFTVYDQFADLSAAMDTIKGMIPQYQGDPEHVYVVGDSGGAYLITYTVAMQNCPKLANAAGVQPSSLHINALGLISGMYYTTKFDNIGLFLPKYLYGKDYKKSSFAPYVNPEHPDIVTSLPPCYLITSEDDNLQHYTLNFEKALSRHHAVHEIKNFPKNKKLTHAFCVFEPYMEESLEAINDIVRFLREY